MDLQSYLQFISTVEQDAVGSDRSSGNQQRNSIATDRPVCAFVARTPARPFDVESSPNGTAQAPSTAEAVRPPPSTQNGMQPSRPSSARVSRTQRAITKLHGPSGPELPANSAPLPKSIAQSPPSASPLLSSTNSVPNSVVLASAIGSRTNSINVLQVLRDARKALDLNFAVVHQHVTELNRAELAKHKSDQAKQRLSSMHCNGGEPERLLSTPLNSTMSSGSAAFGTFLTETAAEPALASDAKLLLSMPVDATAALRHSEAHASSANGHARAHENDDYVVNYGRFVSDMLTRLGSFLPASQPQPQPPQSPLESPASTNSRNRRCRSWPCKNLS